MLDSSPKEKPLAVQIFGSNPEIMAEAAKIVESSGADILDINMGCSVKKIVKTGAGVALMKDPARTVAICTAVRKAIDIPFTVKIRSGWDTSGVQACKISEIAQDCGVDAISVHPRTASQGFRGKADWSTIAAVKKLVSIPVIGNGDIVKPEDAVAMRDETLCDAVMVGRAAIGNPWIFSQILSLAGTGVYSQTSLDDRAKAMKKYLDATVRYFGEKQACRMMRSRLGWFVKGLRNSSRFRESIKRISSEEEAIGIIMSYMNSLVLDLGSKSSY